MNDSQFFIVHKWMVDRLNLRTSERDVFAIIYGFSQDGESDFHGSLSYLSELTGYSRNAVCTALNNLVHKHKFLKKQETTTNNIKQCSYRVDLDTVQATCTPIQATCTGGVQATCTNNIDIDKKEIVNSKNFPETKAEKPKKKKENLYDACTRLIFEHTDISEVRDLLFDLLTKDLANKTKKLGKQQWKGILDKLSKLSDGDPNLEIKIIKQSLDKDYFSVYEIEPKKKMYRTMTEPDNDNASKPDKPETYSDKVF